MKAEPSHGSGSISIWFFIGISLLVNGVVILGAGIYEFIQPPPPEARVVLYQYHASVWWGALLVALGTFYCLHFAPWRSNH
jgi:FtsH-binding integral membrane protein